MNQTWLMEEIRRRVALAGSYRNLGKELGLDPGYLNHVANGRKPGGDALYSALGVVREVCYRRRTTKKDNR